MSSRHDDDLRIAERAAEWHSRLSHAGEQPADAEMRAEFIRWLEESPRHVREFLLMQAWEVQLEGLDAECRIETGPLHLSANVVTLQGARVESGAPTVFEAAARPDGSSDLPTSGPAPAQGSSRRGRRLWPRMAVAAAVAVALIAVAVTALHGVGWQWPADTYATDIDELRSLELPDGSRLELGPRSRLQVKLSEEAREVNLLQGEALFKVARDPTRPFRVQSGASVIQAVGTQFTVNRRPLGTTVAVWEGAVRVFTSVSQPDAASLLTAGEQIRVNRDGAVEKREPLEPLALSSWQQPRLVFRDDPLADIAAEFNRHNRTLEIVVRGERARNKRYGGIFDADDPQAIARFVAHDPDLTVQQLGNRIVIE